MERVADDEVLLEVAPERPLDWLTELPRRVVPLPTEFVVPLSPDVEREGAPVTVVLRDGPELGRVAAPPSTPTLLLSTLLLLTPPSGVKPRCCCQTACFGQLWTRFSREPFWAPLRY